jgi:hypothetical protein
MITDCQVGSLITYKGANEVNGQVLQMESGKFLVSTFWNSTDRFPDISKSYKTVRYDLCAEGKGTRLIITFSEFNETEYEASHSGQNQKKMRAETNTLIES